MSHDVTDEMFLRANSSLRLATPEGIDRAQEIQALEKAGGEEPRSLLSILSDLKLLDPGVETLLQLHRDESFPQTSLVPYDELPAGFRENSGSSMLDLTPVRPLATSLPRNTVAGLDAGRSPPAGTPPVSPVPAAPSNSIALPPEVLEASREARNCLGHFILVREVGKGGMGTVYRAWDRAVGRTVALKLLHDISEDSIDRFIREAHIAGRFHHPSIATVYGVEQEQGRFYIEMQFIDGHPIGRVPRSVSQTLQLIRDAARALHYAHGEGVVHRDIKPGNLLVTGEGTIYITDFGLAKRVIGEGLSRFSLSGSTVGTPEYMSPEQAQGKSRIDARSDVYSLGVTLYTLLAGRPPFREKNIVDLLTAVIERNPPPLRTLNTAISPELEAVIGKAIAKDPARRFATAAAFADELDRLLREKRFLGRYGLAKYLVKKWWLRAAAGVALAFAIRWGLPAWNGPPTTAVEKEDPSRTYRAAADALRGIESGLAILTADQRLARLDQEVFRGLERVLERDPRNLRARVLRARALFVAGRESDLAAELTALQDEKRRDYRISWLRALLVLSEDLPDPPLPALEAPFADWEERHRPWSPVLVAALREVEQAVVEGPLADEYRRDGAAARSLLLLVDSDWATAATALEKLAREQPLPIHERAWVHAAYMAGRFAEVRSHPASLGRRERLGAGMALAARSEQPEENLEKLLEEARGDRDAGLCLRAGLARVAIRRGRDPELHVAAGLALAGEGERERRGVLLASRLSSLALSGRDEETLYQEALDHLGDSPRSWMGRLALIESQVSLATRRVRCGGDAQEVLQRARSRADAMSEAAPEWDALRVQRGLALLRQGKLLDAREELGIALRESTGPGASSEAHVPALLAASSVWLAVAEDQRRNHQSGREDAVESRKHAAAVLSRLPNHPEALNLAAAASLIMVEDLRERGEDPADFLGDALDKVDRALAARPDYAPALVHRAIALYLRSQGRASPESAADDTGRLIGDLDRALSLLPELSAARYFRGIVRFSRGEYAEARDDWKRLLDRDPRWGPDLAGWIRKAEAGGEK